ncbi:MAG: type II secretion system minor pseudopilin GspI [Robiginitomaculum sp.]
MSYLENESGFTLIEVLASLVVFSVGIIGLTGAGTQSARAVSALEIKTLGSIVADNQIVLARSQPLKTGISSGESVVMSRSFSYQLETVKTDVPNFYRIYVKVKRSGGAQTVAERTAYRSRK